MSYHVGAKEMKILSRCPAGRRGIPARSGGRRINRGLNVTTKAARAVGERRRRCETICSENALDT